MNLKCLTLLINSIPQAIWSTISIDSNVVVWWTWHQIFFLHDTERGNFVPWRQFEVLCLTILRFSELRPLSIVKGSKFCPEPFMSFESNPHRFRFVTVSIKIKDKVIVLVLYYTIRSCEPVLLACSSYCTCLSISVWDLEFLCPIDEVCQMIQIADWFGVSCNKIRFDSINDFYSYLKFVKGEW